MKLLTDEELRQALDKDIFHLISETADELGLECYVIGGYVRDLFLERPSNDIDVVVIKQTQQTFSNSPSKGENQEASPLWGGLEGSVGILMASAVQKKLGKKAHLSVFKNFGTAQ